MTLSSLLMTLLMNVVGGIITAYILRFIDKRKNDRHGK